MPSRRDGFPSRLPFKGEKLHSQRMVFSLWVKNSHVSTCVCCLLPFQHAFPRTVWFSVCRQQVSPSPPLLLAEHAQLSSASLHMSCAPAFILANAAQHAVGLPWCEGALLAPGQLGVHWDLWALSANLFSSHPDHSLSCGGRYFSLGQAVVFHFVEHHEVHLSPFLHPAPQCIDCFPVLTSSENCAESTITPLIQSLSKDTKQYWPQYGSLRHSIS